MVAQHQRLAGVERGGDPAAFLGVHRDPRVRVVQRVVLVEGAALLGDRVQQVAERGQGAPVHGVAVGDGHDVGAGGMHLGVHGECRLVDVVAALDHLPRGVHHHKITHGHMLERHSERVDPEAVAVLGIARGDVAGDPVLESEPPEEPQGAGQPFLAMRALVVQ
ncbi:hypothetical protein SAV14893_028010 [Streptomyces avermitilis]|uniref:Uncharacterized protein n=1 Tax=Streptomyces avermitilis TaxID=33903 RepID=A0A4D4LY04_STRAX|nr:hypothetical protein SAV14893_028010 [Streptomyces avermitilis]